MTKEYMKEKMDEFIQREPLLVARFLIQEIERYENALEGEDDEDLLFLDDDYDVSEDILLNEDAFARLSRLMEAGSGYAARGKAGTIVRSTTT